MKKCPVCSEEIQDNAQKCRYCNEWLVPPQPYQPKTPPQSKVKTVSFIFKHPFSKMDNRPLSHGLSNADLGLIICCIALFFSCISILFGVLSTLVSIFLSIGLYMLSRFLNNFSDGDLSKDVKIIAFVELACIFIGLLIYALYFSPIIAIFPLSIVLVASFLYLRVGVKLKNYYDDYESFTRELQMLGYSFITLAVVRLLQALGLGLMLMSPDMMFASLFLMMIMNILLGGGFVFVSGAMGTIFYKMREWKEG